MSVAAGSSLTLTGEQASVLMEAASNYSPSSQDWRRRSRYCGIAFISSLITGHLFFAQEIHSHPPKDILYGTVIVTILTTTVLSAAGTAYSLYKTQKQDSESPPAVLPAVHPTYEKAQKLARRKVALSMIAAAIFLTASSLFYAEMIFFKPNVGILAYEIMGLLALGNLASLLSTVYHLNRLE